MNSVSEYIDILNAARRPLDALREATILDDWTFDETTKKWRIKIRLDLNIQGNQIPRLSDWYIVTGENYPWDPIKIYPDNQNGIKNTYPHQGNNGLIEENELWRKGSLCLDFSVPLIKELGIAEPYGLEDKLLWNVIRACEWLRAADENRLQKIDDFFELPEFSNIEKEALVFSEDSVSYLTWEDIEHQCGLVKLKKYETGKTLFLSDTYYNADKQHTVNKVLWGKQLSGISESEIGLWVLIKSAPVVNNWQAPNTLGELKRALEAQGMELMKGISGLLRSIRDGKRHLLVLGFPIPQKIGDEAQIIYWKALKLPVVSMKGLPGFRDGEKAKLARDKITIFKNEMKLEWLDSQNWSQREITSRGKLDSSIIYMRVLIIGVGCLGATLAELMVRAGLTSLTILDYDLMKVGNLSRHVLSMNDIEKAKHVAVAKHLNGINPHAKINSAPTFNFDNKSEDFLNNYDIVIDCTGANDILINFSKIEFRQKKYFFSLSIGINAQQMYMLLSYSKNVNVELLLDLIRKHIDQEELLQMEFPRDGIGCWHPHFPARADDIWLASSTALKNIESYIKQKTEKSRVLLFEQKQEGGVDNGFCCKEQFDE